MTRAPTKKVLATGVSHPAPFSDAILPVLAELLDGFAVVLDPFAGTGRIHELAGHSTWGVELEPEWAKLHKRTAIGDATALNYYDATFDAICTSPCYGNRMADHHEARDASLRRSYTHDLGRPLSENNTGAMQWVGYDRGPYCEVHALAWAEAVRVLRPGGRFVLNIKDHIRGGAYQDVSAWHLDVLARRLGLHIVAMRAVKAPGMRAGENAAARAPTEYVLALDKAA